MNHAVGEHDARPIVAHPAPHDLYRIFLLRKNGSELLVVGQLPPYSLPCVEIPSWERVAENLTAAVMKRYGVSAVCLFTPEPSAVTTDADQARYQVMEIRKTAMDAPEETRWLPLDSISDQSLAHEPDLLATNDMLRQMAEFERDEALGPFGRPGWINALFSWVQYKIEPYGLRLTGECQQLNASPTFALLRLETNRQAVWFKAVGEPNLREFPISLTLSRIFPGLVPTVIASHPIWRGWLTTEFTGWTLDESPDTRAWERAAQTLAGLQIASIGKSDQLLEAGCRDFRAASLLALVDPFINMMSDFMQRQRKTPPRVLTTSELRTLGAQIKATLSELEELEIPDTLGHLDLNLGNILCSADQCVFLDWAEAYVGPPVLTLEYLREHLTRLPRERVSLGAEALKAYATKWHEILSPETVSRAMELAPVLAVFAYATGISAWQEPSVLQEPRTISYLRSLTRRTHVEMQRLQDGRRTCCN